MGEEVGREGGGGEGGGEEGGGEGRGGRPDRRERGCRFGGRGQPHPRHAHSSHHTPLQGKHTEEGLGCHSDAPGMFAACKASDRGMCV